MMEKSKKTGMNTVKTRHFVMIHKELEKACKKHPKFCDELTALDMGTVRAAEFSFKLVNSEAPYQADMILQEEIYEAIAAYKQGDKKHCLQELAQCGAVILRMMQFVQDEKETKG